MKKDERYHHILEAALGLAQTVGYRSLTRANVAEAAGVAPSLVSHYYLMVELLKMEVLALAVERGILPLVAEGLVAGEAVCLNAPMDLRARAAVSLIGGDA